MRRPAQVFRMKTCPVVPFESSLMHFLKRHREFKHTPGMFKRVSLLFPHLPLYYCSSNSPRQSVPERKLTILDGDDIKWYQLFSRCTSPTKLFSLLQSIFHELSSDLHTWHVPDAQLKQCDSAYEDEKTLSCFHNGFALQTYPRFSRAKVSFIFFLSTNWPILFYFQPTSRTNWFNATSFGSLPLLHSPSNFPILKCTVKCKSESSSSNPNHWFLYPRVKFDQHLGFTWTIRTEWVKQTATSNSNRL